MTTSTNCPAGTGPILAIDLGRYKSVAGAYDPATRAAAFRTLDTGRADFDRLVRPHPSALAVVEAGANAGWAADLARGHGLAVKVANTSGEAWRFTHRKRKTDRDDARRLAESGASVRRRTRLSKAGNARLRKALDLPTLTAVRFNPLLRSFFARLVAAGKPRMLAVGACMRKLVMICYGVLRHRAPFDPAWASRIPR
jgi:transposase